MNHYVWLFIKWFKRATWNWRYQGLPNRCRYCDYLKKCRRPKSEGWKCYNGCLIINYHRAHGYKE